ncbi:MAG: hypothetical protein M1833_000746 [Piccolia ochrophora]|nr:MAG: hypothetical protein M1833_000746 [Piccolia ochrophora]
MVSASVFGERPQAGTPEFTHESYGVAVAFEAIALYIFFEIQAQIFRYFRKYTGLYFWSLQIAAWGVFFHTLGYILKWWAPNSPWGFSTFVCLAGWSAMITGQSLVLYSRLHLVLRKRSVLRTVFIMIVTTFVTLQIPTWVTAFGGAYDPVHTVRWSPPMAIMERIHQVGFFLQETFISVLYIWATSKLLKPMVNVREKRVMWDLILINVIVVCLDVVMITWVYLNRPDVKDPLQEFSYALKLKLEFVVLNQLMAISKGGHNQHNQHSFATRRYRRVNPPTPDMHTDNSADTMKAPILQRAAPAARPSTAPEDSTQTSITTDGPLRPPVNNTIASPQPTYTRHHPPEGRSVHSPPHSSISEHGPHVLDRLGLTTRDQRHQRVSSEPFSPATTATTATVESAARGDMTRAGPSTRSRISNHKWFGALQRAWVTVWERVPTGEDGALDDVEASPGMEIEKRKEG